MTLAAIPGCKTLRAPNPAMAMEPEATVKMASRPSSFSRRSALASLSRFSASCARRSRAYELSYSSSVFRFATIIEEAKSMERSSDRSE